jgi:glucose/arabinose dehydrogenase
MAASAIAAAAGAAGAAVTFTTLVSSVPNPTAFVDPPDGLPHRFVSTQAGQVRVWNGAAPGPTTGTMLDLRDDASVPAGQRKVEAGGERGLLAMTVHPDYAANGFVYLYYTSRNWDGAGGIELGDIVVERYTRAAGDPEAFDPATAEIVLVVSHPDGNHNGGDLKFGPDGYLYVSLGDGGGGCDSTAGSGQDPNQLLGKLLRLDVDGPDAFPGNPLRNYAIPPDNPFVGVAGLDEIWAMGLRNPFRTTFDRSNGDIYIGDVGQNDWEEVNRLEVGAVQPGAPVNFGWPCREGFDPAGCGTPPQGCGASFTDPVRVHANADAGGNWSSIMGGFRYRGASSVADLGGRYVYGDAGNGGVWAATVGAPDPPFPGWTATLLGSGGPYGFAEDQAGELYLLSGWENRVACIHTAGTVCTDWASAGDLFLDGFESGDTSAWSGTIP